MNKYLSSFFVIVLCMPVFMWSMNPLDKARSIVIAGDPCCRIINIPRVREIAFLGNTQLVVHEQDKRPYLINLDTQECSYFSQCISFKCSLTTDQSKQRVLFARQDDEAKIRIYDSVSKDFSSVLITYDDESGKYFPVCFDEKNPNSILVEKGIPTSIISYNYITQKISPENGLSEGFKDDSLQNYKYLYNARLGINGIIGQCPDGFKIYYDSPESVYRQVKKYDVIPTGRQRSYMCAPDFSFIVYYALFHRVFKLSDLPYDFQNEIGVDNGCYISYANGDATTKSLGGNDHISIPCAMVIHPINNKVFAMMLAEDRIIHYFSSQGIFLAEQKISISDKGKFDDEVGTTHKYLDFSANGELLAAVFPRNIAIFNVPFHVQYGMKEDKLLLIVQCLKNYQLNGNLLPRDILRLLFNSLKH